MIMKHKNITPRMSILSIIPVLFIALFFIMGPWGNFLNAAPENSSPFKLQSSFKLPKYEKFVLENGLTVYLMEKHEVPLIYVSGVFPAGAVKDGKLSGLASLTAKNLMFGTKSYTKQQIEEKLEFMGAFCFTSADLEYANVYMSFLDTDTDKALPILKEIIVSPAFNQAEFDKQKKRSLLELEQKKESPGSIVYSYFAKFFYGEHVYGNPVSGIRPTVEKINMDDLKSFYNANYKPAESAIAIVGDFNPSTMKTKITELFKDWQANGKSAPIDQKLLHTPDKTRVLLVNKDDATETQFIIGGPGIPRNNPDYIGIQVINNIIGGHFTSWLNTELRIKNGLTYGAASYFNTDKETGTFVVKSYTRSANTVKAIDMALGILDRLHKNGIDRETLIASQNYVKGQFPPDYETSGQLASFLTSMFIYNYDESFIDNFQANVDNLTLEKAKEIVEKYFPKERLQFVLIGKASEIRDLVKKYGEITEKDIKTDEF
jgi:zinc protease